MARPAIAEQIRDVNQAIERHPKLKVALEIHRKILEIRTPTEESSSKGVTIDWKDESFFRKVQEKAIESGQPIATILDGTIFIPEELVKIIHETLAVLTKDLSVHGLDVLSKGLLEGEHNVAAFVQAFLKKDEKRLRNEADRLHVAPFVLKLVLSVGVQPFLEEAGRRVSQDFLEKWGRIPCPVCGRSSKVVRTRNGRRYLTCVLCGTEYPVRDFLCVFCGNEDPHKQRFLQPKDWRRLRIDFCEQCRHYVKVIDEGKLGEPIPRGLEDMLTLHLDKLAEDAELVR